MSKQEESKLKEEELQGNKLYYQLKKHNGLLNVKSKV